MSYASTKVFTQSEATAAQRTFLFHLTLTADGADATGKTLAGADVRISKAGAALANAAGTVTELADGWYKLELAAADVDTIGALAIDISEALCDDVHVEHQVVAVDPNTAKVAATIAAGDLATDSVTAASVKADAVTKIQAGLASTADVEALSGPLRNVTRVLGTLEADGSTAGVSMQSAVKAIVTLAGTWDGATVTVEYCPNPQAAVPQWLAVASGAKTADGSVTVSGPVNAIRATMSSAGTSEVVCTAEISYSR